MTIIAVSDVHLGYKKWSWKKCKWEDYSNSKDFERFLGDLEERIDKDKITDFVLLGDIMDFWRSRDIDIILEYENILLKLKELKKKVRLHYIVGNHDYYILKLKKMYPEYYPFDVKPYVRLEEGGNKFYFIHGYQLSVFAYYEPLRIDDYERISENMCRFENRLGRFASWCFDIFKFGKKLGRRYILKPAEKRRKEMDKVRQLALSEVKDILLGLQEGERLIFGHTHVPFKEDTAANTGSWIKDAKEQNSYIEIKNGQMNKMIFKKE